ncbi:hypothetical protein ARMA_0889 [Ardenticatena maritima]|uniref:Uncharacterized protein n=1 Tax=Ardenticatena maritima TaxID=872965 RepID=A0A0M8K8J3_9CHLR|nr:hypothetical protein [Ardenticatena maritima]KPL89424.1 hypothetical protein SE16_02960 [Ardenticatena maritima]GAP62466.1 hypothetical protein ARMA_0889 [Ardenticatena maritima]
MRTSKTSTFKWPTFPVLAALFVVLRLLMAVMYRPGGYLRPFPAIGQLGGSAFDWRGWLLYGVSPLEWLVRSLGSHAFSSELARQLAFTTFTLPFELLTLWCIYALVRDHLTEQRARRAAWVWGAFWFPVWLWLTSLNAVGAGLALLALWLAPRRRDVAVLVGVLAALWMPFALVFFAFLWATRQMRHTQRWALTAVLLAPFIFLPPQEEHLLMLLAAVAAGGAGAWAVILAALLSLLFVLHQPIAPFLLSVESRTLPLLTGGMVAGMVGLQAVLLGRAWRRHRVMQWSATVACAVMVGVLLLSAGIGAVEWRATARAESPYSDLLDTLAVAPAGYVLLGSHSLYEAIYPFTPSRHVVRVVSERNADTLIATIRARPGPVWMLGHPLEHEAWRRVFDQLAAEGYITPGAWYDTLRLEMLTLVPPDTRTQPDVAFADATTLREAAWRSTVSPGDMLSVELVWDVPEHAIESLVFVHVRTLEHETIAQIDHRPEWTAGRVIQKVAVPLPPDAQAGTYRLVVGRYIPATGERVLLADGASEYELGTITIEATGK